eukprot:gene3155-5900_t
MQKECIFVISSKCEQATLVGRGVLGRCRAPARLASKLIIKHGGIAELQELLLVDFEFGVIFIALEDEVMVRKKMHRRLYNNFCSSYSEVTQSESRSDSTYLNVMEEPSRCADAFEAVVIWVYAKTYIRF